MGVVGVDGCRAGWVGVHLSAHAAPIITLFPSIQALWDTWGTTCSWLLIDIPIGLPDTESSRLCDRAARRLLGAPRASSVFNPPARPALPASSWEEAARLNEAATGKRISRQTWGIVPKIREVDAFLRASSDRQAVIRETHPELLFAALNGGLPTQHSKKRSAGLDERLHILERHLPGSAPLARHAFADYPRKKVQRDDIVDALAAAVAAFCYGERLRALPASPPRDRVGLRMEIVVPNLAFPDRGEI